MLAEARVRARQARQLLLDGKDPLVVKHAERIASRLPMNMPFKEAAQKFIEVHAVRPLEGLYRDQSDWVFFGAKPVKPLSHDAMRKVLGRLRPGLTVHGFRSCFRDWAGDQTPFASEVIDFALAHSIPDKTSAAYRRYTALEKRRKLMEAWAQYCSAPVSGGKVVALHG